MAVVITKVPDHITGKLVFAAQENLLPGHKDVLKDYHRAELAELDVTQVTILKSSCLQRAPAIDVNEALGIGR